MADFEHAPVESVAEGDVHAVGKEALACDALKGGAVDACGDAIPVVTSENGVNPAVTSQITEEKTIPVEAAQLPATETGTDTADSSYQTGTKRKTDVADDVTDAGGEGTKKVKKVDELPEVAGSEAAVTEDTMGSAETNGKPQDEIITKTVDDVVHADKGVEAV